MILQIGKLARLGSFRTERGESGGGGGGHNHLSSAGFSMDLPLNFSYWRKLKLFESVVLTLIYPTSAADSDSTVASIGLLTDGGALRLH